MSLYYLRRRESVFRRGKTKRFDEPSQAIAGQDDIPRLFSRSPRVFAEAAELEKAAHRRPRHLRRFSTARTRSLSFLARALGRVMPAERRSKRVLRRRSLPRDARNWPAWAASCWRMRVSAGPVSGAGRDSSKLISSPSSVRTRARSASLRRREFSLRWRRRSTCLETRRRSSSAAVWNSTGAFRGRLQIGAIPKDSFGKLFTIVRTRPERNQGGKAQSTRIGKCLAFLAERPFL